MLITIRCKRINTFAVRWLLDDLNVPVLVPQGTFHFEVIRHLFSMQILKYQNYKRMRSHRE